MVLELNVCSLYLILYPFGELSVLQLHHVLDLGVHSCSLLSYSMGLLVDPEKFELVGAHLCEHCLLLGQHHHLLLHNVDLHLDSLG